MKLFPLSIFSILHLLSFSFSKLLTILFSLELSIFPFLIVPGASVLLLLWYLWCTVTYVCLCLVSARRARLVETATPVRP